MRRCHPTSDRSVTSPCQWPMRGWNHGRSRERDPVHQGLHPPAEGRRGDPLLSRGWAVAWRLGYGSSMPTRGPLRYAQPAPAAKAGASTDPSRNEDICMEEEALTEPRNPLVTFLIARIEEDERIASFVRNDSPSEETRLCIWTPPADHDSGVLVSPVASLRTRRASAAASAPRRTVPCFTASSPHSARRASSS